MNPKGKQFLVYNLAGLLLLGCVYLFSRSIAPQIFPVTAKNVPENIPQMVAALWACLASLLLLFGVTLIPLQLTLRRKKTPPETKKTIVYLSGIAATCTLLTWMNLNIHTETEKGLESWKYGAYPQPLAPLDSPDPKNPNSEETLHKQIYLKIIPISGTPLLIKIPTSRAIALAEQGGPR